MPEDARTPAVLCMRTLSPPVHRAHRRALAAQLDPSALRTRPYAHPVAENATEGLPEELGTPGLGHQSLEARR